MSLRRSTYGEDLPTREHNGQPVGGSTWVHCGATYPGVIFLELEVTPRENPYKTQEAEVILTPAEARELIKGLERALEI